MREACNGRWNIEHAIISTIFQSPKINLNFVHYCMARVIEREARI